MRVLSTLRRGWIPLVLVAVVALSGFVGRGAVLAAFSSTLWKMVVS